MSDFTVNSDDSDECLLVEDGASRNDMIEEEATQPTNKCIEISAVINILDNIR